MLLWDIKVAKMVSEDLTSGFWFLDLYIHVINMYMYRVYCPYMLHVHANPHC